jgi:dipeptidyl-peptidase-4
MKSLFCITLGLLVVGHLYAEEGQLLSVENLYHPRHKFSFEGSPPSILRWRRDGKHYLRWERTPDGGSKRLVQVNAISGKTQIFYENSKIRDAFMKNVGLNREQAGRLVRDGEFRLSPDEGAVLIQYRQELFYFHFEKGRALRLTDSKALEREPDFSPDSQFVSFVRDHDLYVVDIEKGIEKRLTQSGGSDLLNGILDWVYQEEIYGRGDFKGYWWSPDSSSIAYLQLDVSAVPGFTVTDHIPRYLRKEITRYPKAGESNPVARLGVVASTGGRTKWLDLSRYKPEDLLIVQVGWKDRGQKIVFQVQNRKQTWLDLNLGDPNGGGVHRILRETTIAWVNVLGEPYWLRDGTFLWQSERSGWRHLYHYDSRGRLLRVVTKGEWEVRSLEGVNEENGWIYFAGTRRSPVGVDIYRVTLGSGTIKRLSQREGEHAVLFNKQLTHYVDTWSNLVTPTQVHLMDSTGQRVRTIYNAPIERLHDLRLGRPELLQVPSRDGFMMEAILITPPDFNPSKRYPVLVHIYGGPHTQRVKNAWGGRTYLWHQMLAQKGYLIWICDNRSASGKGAQSTWPIYKNFGKLEHRDIEDGVNWLKAKPWVDSQRLGLWGWSFGGFMTAYSMTHSDSFKIGIAGAPVTDWSLYDTIYTERYMDTPQANPEGYQSSSVIRAAKDLKGKLLLIHGNMDGNVHIQNTFSFVYELQKAGRQFELMVYPRSSHGVRDSSLVYHLRKMMTEYIEKNL